MRQGSNKDRVRKKFTPIGDLIALQVIKVTETEGGIAIPEISQDRYSTPQAWVVSVGPEVKQVKAGDRVLCRALTPAVKVVHDGDDLVVVHEKDIVGVIDRSAIDN